MTDSKINAAQRILLLDALRGFALLGILISHFHHWYVVGPLPDTVLLKNEDLLTKVTEWLIANFVSSKFYQLFSFIFGFSFYLQTVSFAKNFNNIDVLFIRRAAFLFLIGAIHYMLWNGDILAVYAILMLPLIILRRLGNKWLLFIGIIMVMNLPGMALEVFHYLKHGTSTIVVANSPTSPDPVADNLYNVVTRGGIRDMLHFNYYYIHGRLQYQFYSGSIFIILGFFTLGMYTGRKGWFQKIHLLKGKLTFIAIATFLLIAAAQTLSDRYLFPQAANSVGCKLSLMFVQFATSIMSIIMYVSLVATLFFIDFTKGIASLLTDIGKMALSMYLFQTLIGLLLFYHIGFGVFSQTSMGVNFLLAIGIYIVQLFIAKAWFKFFNFGIVEWLLRAGTLWQFKDLVKRKDKDVN